MRAPWEAFWAGLEEEERQPRLVQVEEEPEAASSVVPVATLSELARRSSLRTSMSLDWANVGMTVELVMSSAVLVK